MEVIKKCKVTIFSYCYFLKHLLACNDQNLNYGNANLSEYNETEGTLGAAEHTLAG